MRLLFRAPLWLYRLGLGWLLDARFLMLEHKGRRSGRRRRAVIEVIARDESTRTYWVAAAWGSRSDWYRNVQEEPNVRVTVGRRRFPAVAEPLSREDSCRVLQRYVDEHALAARGLTRLLGYDSVEDLKNNMPVVELRPRPGSDRLEERTVGP